MITPDDVDIGEPDIVDATAQDTSALSGEGDRLKDKVVSWGRNGIYIWNYHKSFSRSTSKL